MSIILTYVIVLALVACVPMILDIFKAYQSHNETKKLLIEKIPQKDLKTEEIKEFIKEIDKAPPGIPGLARATMALAVITILGIAVIHVLVRAPFQEHSPQIVSNVLSILAGLLSAITGFYFGGKAAEKKTVEETKKPPTS